MLIPVAYMILLSFFTPHTIHLILPDDASSWKATTIASHVDMDLKKWKLWRMLNPLYENFMILFLILFLTSMCMFILRNFKVNYLYIFDITPSTQVTRYQLLSVSLLMALLGSVAILHQDLLLSLDHPA